MRALLIVPRLPGTGFTGDRVRAAQHVAALTVSGFRTTVVGGVPPGRRPSSAVGLAGHAGIDRVVPVATGWLAVAAALPWHAIRGEPLQSALLAGRWDAALRDAGTGFDLTVVLLARLWPYVERHIRPPVVLDFIDALGAGARQASSDEPRLWRRAYWRWEAPRLERLEWRAAERAVLRLVTAPADARALPPDTVTLPLGVTIGPEPPPGRGQVVAFSGRLGYRPNELGVRRLLREIWPRVLVEAPEAELWIGGADPPRWLRALAGGTGRTGGTRDRVRLFSPVADMSAFLRQARAVAAPVALGSGTQLKLLEALEAGAAVVASPEVVSRAGEPSPPVRVASSHDAFAADLVALLKDPSVAAREGTAGRTWVKAHADRARFTDLLAGHYRRLGES